MKKTLFLITLVLSGSVLFPLKNTVAQRLYSPQQTIPGVSGNCLNYMIMETGEFTCLSYSKPVEIVPTTTTPAETTTTDQPTDQQIAPVNNQENLAIPPGEAIPSNNTPVGENLLK